MEIDRYFLDIIRDIKNLADPFLQQHGLNYFQYASVFQDDTTTALATHPDFIQARFRRERRILSHIDTTQIDQHAYIFLWNDCLPKDDTDMAREFGIDNGLCFIERFPDHYNLIAFGTPLGRSHANSYYLNNLSKLWGFAKQFTAQASPFLDVAYAKRMAVPEQNNDVNRHQLFLERQHAMTAFYNGIHVSLSAMEYKCLELVARSMTMKGSAELLGISARTVETYLNRVKSKAGLATKQDLVVFFTTQFCTSF